MDYKIQPWKHQLDAIQRAKTIPNFALFFEQGCGKTAALINILRQKYETAGIIKPTLILCPLIVVENWRREFLAHSKIPDERIIPLTGPQGNRRFQFLRPLTVGRDLIAVTNYEAMQMEGLFADIMEWKPEILVLDESHKCKDIQAKRTKKVIKISDQAEHKYLLSGTPILNSPMDLFSQFRILDGGATFTSNFFVFRSMYFVDKNRGAGKQNYFPNWVPQRGSLEKINTAISPVSMRVTKAQCLDLPPLVKQVLHVEMSEDQARMYKEMKEDFITYLKGKACVATMAMTKALRLMQIVSGYVKLEDETQVSIKDTPRMAVLRELLESIAHEHKVIVWAVFKENYVQIRKVCESLKLGYVELTGDTAPGNRQAAVDAFHSQARVRVLIGHPGSGGIGVNLTAASYCIFFSRNFSLENDLQAEARNHRGGSEIHDKITRIDLVAPKTIDELVMKSLANKEKISEGILSRI